MCVHRQSPTARSPYEENTLGMACGYGSAELGNCAGNKEHLGGGGGLGYTVTECSRSGKGKVTA